MKIIGLKIRAVNIPLIKPYTISLLGEVTTTRSVIVEVFTEYRTEKNKSCMGLKPEGFLPQF